MQEKKKMYRAIHRTANAGFDIWFVCVKNKIEARKIIIDKTGCGIVEFPDYQGIPEIHLTQIKRGHNIVPSLFLTEILFSPGLSQPLCKT